MLTSTIKSQCKPLFVLSVLVHLRQFRRLVGGDARVNNLLDISVHHLVKLIDCQVDAVVCHAPLREIVRPDLLGAVARPNLAPAHLRLRVVALLLLDVIQLCPQQGKRLCLILQL